MFVHSTKKPKNVSAIDFKEMRNMLLSSMGMHEKSLTSLEEAPSPENHFSNSLVVRIPGIPLIFISSSKPISIHQ
jgi:hypothetical protein